MGLSDLRDCAHVVRANTTIGLDIRLWHKSYFVISFVMTKLIRSFGESYRFPHGIRAPSIDWLDWEVRALRHELRHDEARLHGEQGLKHA
ncbi:hypothetical protein BH23GEM8_BH23GEM8_15820 [soil metagenome]